jgi:type III restriction enzyme
MLVDNPLLNSPFGEPTRYWAYEQGHPVIREGRRPAGYYLRPRTRGPQMALLEEEFIPLDLVNAIRERVKAWREQGYPGVTPITRQLLAHWNRPDRERPLFFCQREAAETLIWLVEASPAEKQGIHVPDDNGLTRYACKMATGSGKTVVMGMVIAWQVLNKLANPRDRRFSDAVLIVCPNSRSSSPGSQATTTRSSTWCPAGCWSGCSRDDSKSRTGTSSSRKMTAAPGALCSGAPKATPPSVGGCSGT